MKTGRKFSMFLLTFFACFSLAFLSSEETHRDAKKEKWISLFNGKNLKGWTQRGVAEWKVENGVIVGQGGLGHLYADPVATDLEVKGEFRIVDLGGGANGGLYIRANEEPKKPEGFPVGYEAQICHNQKAFTGWLWKPGKPTGAASALLTKDGEWFPMRVRMVGTHVEIWVKDSLVTVHDDSDYSSGKFVLQCHNKGMRMEAKNLYYREIK